MFPTKATPAGWPRISSALFYDDAGAAIDWLCKAFGFDDATQQRLGFGLPDTYASWGRLVAGQPDQIGYAIIDAKSMGKFMPPVYPPMTLEPML